MARGKPRGPGVKMRSAWSGGPRKVYTRPEMGARGKRWGLKGGSSHLATGRVCLGCTMQPDPLPQALLRAPWGTVGRQSHPVRKRTQALNKFIQEKLRETMFWLEAPEVLVRTAVRAGGAPRAGVGGADSRPGDTRADTGRCGTKRRSLLPTRPVPRTPLPLWVKVQLGGR